MTDGRVQKTRKAAPKKADKEKNGGGKPSLMNVIPKTEDVEKLLEETIKKQTQEQKLQPPPMRRICACGSLTCPDGPWYGWMWIKG